MWMAQLFFFFFFIDYVVCANFLFVVQDGRTLYIIIFWLDSVLNLMLLQNSVGV